jgi:uncharacterized protein YfaS (alpha-2-macroglobulin family)
MKKRNFYPVICLAFLLSALFSCVNRKSTIAPESGFAPYISAYTGGLIYRTSTIRVKLTKEIPGISPGAEVKEKVFSFSPSIKGKTYWIDNNILEFVPEPDALKSGETYQAEFHLGKLIKVDSRLKIFQFSFKVEERKFEIMVNPLQIEDEKSVVVTGRIFLSEETDIELVNKAFSAKTSDNQKITAKVQNTDDPKVCQFEIDDVKRKDESITLKISLEGKSIGFGKTISEEIAIPAMDAFSVLNTEIITEPQHGVRITFSSPLSETQDKKGLINIPELNEYNLSIQKNQAIIYFDAKGVSKITVNVDGSLKDIYGHTLEESYSTEIIVEPLKPAVELLKSGNIIPDSENLILPFRAVNLKAVDLKVIKIFENNIMMFLQTNTYNGSDDLRRSGRFIHKETIRLDSDPTKKLDYWQNYSIDLSKIIQQEPGAIYRIEFSFKKEYANYECEKETVKTNYEDEDKYGSYEDEEESGEYYEDNMVRISSEETDEESVWDIPNAYYSEYDYDWRYYRWEERGNPCHPTYYMMSERKVSCNIMQSNIGLIAKSNSNNRWWFAVTNLLDTKPVSGADITIYNYQLQTLATVKTDADGFAVISPKGKPFMAIASDGKHKTYLRLIDGEENSLSRFDVGGEKIDKGLKGYIYGERGVWRPGDTLHISFILFDMEKKIPENHPVSLELYNSRGQFFSKQISTQGLNGFYVFSVPTNAGDPTGLWNSYIKVGGTTFHKSVRIETIKPNRLKINLSLPGERINASEGNVPATLTSTWLTGAIAHNLKTKVEMRLTRATTQFKEYKNYIFNNPASNFSSNESVVYEGELDDNGKVHFDFNLPEAKESPGLLNANIICRVFETGGDASIYTQNTIFSPFNSYVGVNLNVEKNKYIETVTDHSFDIITLDASGKPVNRNDLEYKIYRIDWSWWWDSNSESFANYVNNSSYQPVETGNLKTVNGKASFKFKVKYPDWGRYFVYVKDPKSGHASGGMVYIDWPSWRGRSGKKDPEGIKMLSFSTDKDTYDVGEDITVVVPASAGGTALLALENGSTIMDRKWINVSEKEDTKYTFKATKEMAPNFYIHISLLQAHAQTVNDLPIRLYGVIPVIISNKESILDPQINMPDVLRPDTEFSVEVSEKNGKPMTYTLAIVDDGLLDFTNFKTPNAWDNFYAREALGIRTWDMFDYVLGAFGGKLSGMFSIGGDEYLNTANTKANRFKPVVKFVGPFTLKGNEKKKHDITLPAYVGSVRTMVVAGQDGAFGKAEKTTPVRTPLMLLSSLPRILATKEEISLPVNVFAMENSVNKASVKVETTGLLQLNDSNNKTIEFDKPGDQMVYFSMKTGTKSGVEKVTITATGNGKTAKETIEMEVRNPNPAIILTDNKILEDGQTSEFAYQLTGNSDDDWVKLETSRIPSVNIVKRFDFLYNYNHYCSEQLTSRALPLLYLSEFKIMDSKETETVKKNIREAIKNLYGRQLNNGGIAYWPGENHVDEWVCSYAGSFLVFAKERGYEVNEGVLNKWKNYQRSTALNWTPNSNSSSHYEYGSAIQAYRLYSLALAGAPELGAMNRLKEVKNLSLQARWSLAAAYALSGKSKPAEELIFNQPTDVPSYRSSYTYGSSKRDEAMILQTLVAMGRTEDAFKSAIILAKKLSNETYYDTQSTAHALVAIGALAEKTSGKIEFDWTLNGKKQNAVQSTKAGYQTDLPKSPAEGKISLTNKNKGSLYVNLVSKSKPLVDTFPAISNNIELTVKYTDLNGKEINVDEITQGTDFVAAVKVKNTGVSFDYTYLALTHAIPSGWEIFNERMTNSEGENAKTSNSYTYQDIRDNLVLTYFDLPYNAEKTFKIRLQASYIGSFVLPAISCEAMYEPTVFSRTEAGRITIIK